MSAAIKPSGGVAIAAITRTLPLTTIAGDAPFLPLARRSWRRALPKMCSRSLLVRGKVHSGKH